MLDTEPWYSAVMNNIFCSLFPLTMYIPPIKPSFKSSYKLQSAIFLSVHSKQEARRSSVKTHNLHYAGGGGGTPDFKWQGWLEDFFGLQIFDFGIFWG